MQHPARQRPHASVSGVRARSEHDGAGSGGSDSGETPVSTWLLELFDAPDYRPPVLPRVAMQLLTLTKNPDVKLTEVALLLEQDPMLAAAMLRLANSAVLRAGREVATIDQAIMRLGLRRVTEMVLEAAVNLRVFQAKGYESVMEQLRVHSSATAHVARMLSRFCGVDPGEAFVAGLLHDVGIAASLIAISDHFKAKALPPVDSVWSAVLGRHAASGALLQQSWGLPQSLGHVLAHHHAPKQTTTAGPLPALIALADALVSEFGVPILDEVPEDAARVAEDALGLDAGLLERARGAAQNLVELIEQRD